MTPEESDELYERWAFPDRAHSLTVDSGWREVADVALAWLAKHSVGPDIASAQALPSPREGRAPGAEARSNDADAAT